MTADAAPAASPTARHPPWAAIGLAALTLAVSFVAIVGRAIGARAFAFDGTLLLAMRRGDGSPIGPQWLPRTVTDITTLGDGPVLTLVVAVAIGFLLTLRRWPTALLVLAGTWSGSVAIAVAKSWFARARPTLTEHLVTVGNASFPSGHAANSAIVYLTITALLTQIVEGRAQRRYLWGVAIVLVTAIGMSRVYVGVHWPSDVVAGWCFGALWALAWWSAGALIRQHAMRRTERDDRSNLFDTL